MYLLKDLLKFSVLPYVYIIDIISFLKSIKCDKFKTRFKYDYKDLSRSILCNIEDSD